MDETVDYTLRLIDQIKKEVSRSGVEIEVSVQKGNGHHLFNFMDKLVWKKYLGITNIVVRLSDGTPQSKENSILVNAHLDSTLPSPGAADDAAGVAVMLESLRIMAQTPDLKLNNAILFLFNGG
jgi:Zn-dependent M28 family amino/carboxypeptidase